MIVRNQKGFIEVLALVVFVMFGVLIAELYSSGLPATFPIEQEARQDLRRITDRISLTFASEEECTTAFTTAPLNALNFTDGDKGTVAMDFVAPIVVRGVQIASVGESIVGGGQVTRIWLENQSKLGTVGGWRHFHANLRIQGTSTGFLAPTSEILQFGAMVDTTNKIRFCYLNESVAIKTCEMAGGYFDPSKSPRCQFNFSGRTCADPSTCLTGLDSVGNLLCSAPMPVPTPTPPPLMLCYCGCTQTFTSGGGMCGWEAVQTTAAPGCAPPLQNNAHPGPGPNPSGFSVGDLYTGLAGHVVCNIIDLSNCVQSAGPPGGCP